MIWDCFENPNVQGHGRRSGWGQLKVPLPWKLSENLSWKSLWLLNIHECPREGFFLLLPSSLSGQMLFPVFPALTLLEEPFPSALGILFVLKPLHKQLLSPPLCPSKLWELSPLFSPSRNIANAGMEQTGAAVIKAIYLL